MAKIFISYRREDAKGVAKLLSDRLGQHFGKDEVFYDVESIRGGEFPPRIEEEANSCAVMIVLIGQNWLRPELDSDNDYVHMECRIGLAKKCLMIPTRIDGAPLPAPKKLPADIARLVKFQAREIRLDCFEGDFRNLVEIVETKVRPKKATSSGW